MVGHALQSRDEVAGLVVVDRVFVVELPEIPSLAGGLIPSPPGDCARPGGLRIPSLLAGGALAEMNRCAGSTPFFCVCPPVCKRACSGREQTQKKTGRFSSSGSFLRRGRDSNPRILSDQRFSRPPQSTTLPPLLPLWDCKYRNNFFLSKIILHKMHKKLKNREGQPKKAFPMVLKHT